MDVIELFAGVGGFRIGLNRANDACGSHYSVVWSNQWEPATKAQHASDVYVARFGPQGHCNDDIAKVIAERFHEIPDHDLLVGGFPCQDYSVAKTLSQSAGINGKKGVLWWSIHGILEKKEDKPRFLMLENVDRLLKSPAKQRGRDFAIILASLADLGYIAEWRVINAADYGFPQRRRRTFILAYHSSSKVSEMLRSRYSPEEWVLRDGTMATAFPVCLDQNLLNPINFPLHGSLADITDNFNKSSTGTNESPFENAGIMIDRKVWTFKTKPSFNGPRTVLGDILIPENEVPEEFFISEEALPRWEYLKGGKSEIRKTQAGHEYHYSEGGMAFPDPLDKPSRTIITGEGGASASRFKHVVQQTPGGRLRRLTPIELERLDMFPDNHTAGKSNIVRAFFMGNALVVGVIQKLGESLHAHAIIAGDRC